MDNQQRAAEVWASMLGDGPGDFTMEPTRVIAAALDAAEARGRAELAAKVRELADELERTPVPVGWTGADAADRLRALIADDTARTTSSRGPEPIADFPDGPDARDGTQ